MKAAGAVLAGFWLCLAAEPAAACSLIFPAPRAGETVRQASIRGERAEQRRLRAASTHLYLARVEHGRDDAPRFVALARIEGGMPPRRISDPPTGNCGTTAPAPGETRLMFVRQIRPADAPWQPWTWGKAEVLASRLPRQIIDAGIVDALSRAIRSRMHR